jgi:hypothetical protein
MHWRRVTRWISTLNAEYELLARHVCKVTGEINNPPPREKISNWIATTTWIAVVMLNEVVIWMTTGPWMKGLYVAFWGIAAGALVWRIRMWRREAATLKQQPFTRDFWRELT